MCGAGVWSRADAGVNLLWNASFESPVLPLGTNLFYGSNQPAGTFIGDIPIPAGDSISIGGWIASAAVAVDLYSAGFGYPVPTDGRQAVYLGENGAGGQGGQVTQWVRLTPGVYTLTWDQSGISLPSQAGISVSPEGGGPIATGTFDNAGAGWESHGFTFTITATQYYGVEVVQTPGHTTVVDDVVLVPAPGAAGFVGVAGLLLWRRRLR